MIKGVYSFAELNFLIISNYSFVHDFMKEYKTDSKNIDFTVVVNEQEICKEQQFLRELGPEDEYIESKCRPENAERIVVLKKIAEQALDYDIILYHGSVIAVNNEAYMFTANSGTGKSTHVKLWRELLGDKSVMVNDDKPLIKIKQDKVIAYGTPYNGKHHLGNDIGVPLKAVAVIYQAEENIIEEIDKKTAYPMLYKHVYHPEDKVKLLKTMDLLNRMVKNISIYKLGCNMDISAAELAWKTMRGNEYEAKK